MSRFFPQDLVHFPLLGGSVCAFVSARACGCTHRCACTSWVCPREQAEAGSNGVRAPDVGLPCTLQGASPRLFIPISQRGSSCPITQQDSERCSNLSKSIAREHCDSVPDVWGHQGWGNGSHKPYIYALPCLEDLLQQAVQFYCPRFLLGRVRHFWKKEGRERSTCRAQQDCLRVWTSEIRRRTHKRPRESQQLINFFHHQFFFLVIYFYAIMSVFCRTFWKQLSPFC